MLCKDVFLIFVKDSVDETNCRARVQVPNPLTQQAPTPDPKFRQSLKKQKLFGLGMTQ